MSVRSKSFTDTAKDLFIQPFRDKKEIAAIEKNMDNLLEKQRRYEDHLTNKYDPESANLGGIDDKTTEELNNEVVSARIKAEDSLKDFMQEKFPGVDIDNLTDAQIGSVRENLGLQPQPTQAPEENPALSISIAPSA